MRQKHKFKPGDKVRLLRNVKDHYGEIWHDKGEIVEIKYIAGDGEGLMFHSNLGIHYTQVERV